MNAKSETERLARLAETGGVNGPDCARIAAKLRALDAANKEWHDKTEWLRKDLQPNELGKHLADVLRERAERRAVERGMAQRDAVNLARVDITDDRFTLSGAMPPMQPVVKDTRGVHRFLENKCVNDLLEHGTRTGFGLNQMAAREYSDEDRMQLAQLIGYSVSGYGSLSYVSDASYDKAVEAMRDAT